MDNVPIILGQYKMGKTLGIGAFGKVKLAHHMPTGQKVCVLTRLVNAKCDVHRAVEVANEDQRASV
jgi:hypothetical protein